MLVETTHCELVGGRYDGLHIEIEEPHFRGGGTDVCVFLSSPETRVVFGYQGRGPQLKSLGELTIARCRDLQLDLPGFELQRFCSPEWLPFAMLHLLADAAQEVELEGPLWRVVHRGEVVYAWDELRICPTCQGQGYIEHGWGTVIHVRTCMTCDGAGEIPT